MSFKKYIGKTIKQGKNLGIILDIRRDYTPIYKDKLILFVEVTLLSTNKVYISYIEPEFIDFQMKKWGVQQL